MRRILILTLLALCLLTACAQAEYIMTEEEMAAIWQESFAKMNTGGMFSVMTLEDLPAFEERYTRDTGRDRKDDLVISSLPMEGDMPYEQALAYARQLIFDKFATPVEELDAMGVYPRLIDYVYMDNESEWEFYFTPRTDTDIDLDHTYDGQGEYRVHFGAQTGAVSVCNWYIDAFFPHYAQRTWDAGLHDYVYQRAQRQDFFTQPMEQQAHFISLFQQEGYDVSALERTDAQLLEILRLDLKFCEPEASVLHSDDPMVKAALAAMEAEYGLTLEMLDACAYTATWSPMQRGTRDLCFAYNYNIESAMYDSGALSQHTGQLFSYVSRLGLYMVSLDPQSGAVVSTTRVDRGPQAVQALDESLLLGRRSWTVDDLPLFFALLEEIDARTAEAAAQGHDIAYLEALTDTLMREAGGDPDVYSRQLPEAMAVPEADALAAARRAALIASGMEEAAFDAYYDEPFVHVVSGGVYYILIYTKTVDAEGGDNHVYQVQVNGETGDVTRIEYTDGVG